MPYDIPEMPEDSDACKKVVRAALQSGQDRMCRMEKSQIEMRAALDENTDLTRQCVEIVQAFSGGMKVLNWLGVALKWGAMVAGSVYTFYCIAKGKNPFM